MKELHMVTFLLVIVGALNWGLVGLFDFNLVSFLVGGFPVVERVVYVLVGLSALVEVFNHSSSCKWCGK
jgi:uncharacterized membrane protein YuzA (DUF378 family)